MMPKVLRNEPFLELLPGNLLERRTLPFPVIFDDLCGQLSTFVDDLNAIRGMWVVWRLLLLL